MHPPTVLVAEDTTYQLCPTSWIGKENSQTTTMGMCDMNTGMQ